jgi:hypothetical protein
MEIILFIVDNIASIVNLILASAVIVLLKSIDCLKIKLDRLEYAVDYLLKKEDEK